MLRIKEIRKSKKITAKALADQVNVAESTMSLYENGKREPDFETLSKIANYLEVSIDYLLGNSDISTPNANSETSQKEISEYDLQVALFGGAEHVSDENWKKVKEFAEFLKNYKPKDNK